MKATNKLILPLALLATSAGCIVPPEYGEEYWQAQAMGPKPDYWQSEGRFRQGEPGAPATPGVVVSTPVDGDPTLQEGTPLLGWDGGVVDGNPAGSVVSDDSAHGIEPSTAGRMHIIELYQEVLDERDALADEVDALTSQLELAHGELAELQTTALTMETSIAALEEARDALLQESRDLTARLTTAQIRRLEAEKLLLEGRIYAARQRNTVGALPLRDTSGGSPLAGDQ